MKQKQITRTIMIVLSALAILLFAGSLWAQAAKERSEIDPQYKWKLEDLYSTVEAWNTAFAALDAAVPRLEAFKGRLSESAPTLLQCLELNDSLNSLSHRLRVYANLKLDEDKRVGQSQELADRILSLGSRVSSAGSFIDPELLSIDTARIQEFLSASPKLQVYRFYLENLLRTKSHILSDKEEDILAKVGPVTGSFINTFNLIDNGDISFGTIKDENGNDIQLTKGRTSVIMRGPDRRMRRDAFYEYNKVYWRYINGLAANLAASINKDYFFAQVRNYPTCLDMQLDGYNAPTSVFRNIIAAANANLAPLHKWASIRKRILGLDTLRSFDLFAPLGADVPKTYTWEEAKQMVAAGLTPMGKKYEADLQMGMNSGWIDVYESRGKESGGYNWGTYTSHPYILLNYNGSLEEVFTVAHEMGHALHAYYQKQREPYVYYGSYTFTAEVASTCNEALLMKYLVANTKDKKEKMLLLKRYIEQIIGTFYTQLWYSEFELAIHDQVEKGGALSVDFFRKSFRDIYQKYWGPELVLDTNNELGGMRVYHFYRPYYVYQYAVGYAAAQVVSQRILNKEKGALEAYQQFLNTGSSKYPIDILKDAGVDVTTPEPVARTIKIFGELVDEMEKLLNEK